MHVTEWYDLFVEQIVQTDVIQWIVLITGVSEVLLARANHVGLYAAGLISSLLSIYSLFTAQLYAESILGMYYVVMSVYGWWFWVKKKYRPAIPVTFTNRQEWYDNSGYYCRRMDCAVYIPNNAYTVHRSHVGFVG